jgi:gluconokinase
MDTRFYIVMGVSGSGKTTVGKALASELGWDFYDADDFHPPENISKMENRIPLTDADRAPWLAALHKLIESCLTRNRPGVLACSALKESYREKLLEGNAGVQIIHLTGSYELIWSRMASRKDHYMKPEMLKSQFDALEEPADAIIIDISHSVDEIVQEILRRINLKSNRKGREDREENH